MSLVPHARPTRWLAVSPDGDRIVQTSLEPTGPAGYTLQVMDLSTGTVTAVPGLQLGAASPSAAFTPDSQWMIVAVPTLIGGRILLYDTDLQGPYETGATVPGPQIGTVPLDVVDSHSAAGDATTSTTQPAGESFGRDHISLSCDDSAGDLPTGNAADNITIGGADLTGLRGNQTPVSAADAGLVVGSGADWYFRKTPVYIKAGAGPVTLTLHGAAGQFLSWVPASVWTSGHGADLGPWGARSVTLEGCADHGAMYLGGLLATGPGEDFEIATSGGVSSFAAQVSLEAGGRILSAHSFIDGCGHARPITYKFPGHADVVMGPLSYAGLRAYANSPVNEMNWSGGYFTKSGAQLPPGASVTVTIDDSAAGYAAIVTEAGPDTGSRSVTYRSCQQPDSTGSWWVGGLVLFGRNTACVPMTVTDQKNHTTHRAVVSLGAGACPGT